MQKENTTNKKDLNILHVTPFYPPSIGGISNLVYNVCNALIKYNNNIHVITARNLKGNNNFQKERTIEITEIKSLYFPGWPYSTLKNFSIPMDLGIRINTIIKHGKFDIIHVHGHHYPITWISIYSAFRHNIPVILSLHGTYALNPKVLGGKSLIEELFNMIIFKNILSKSDIVIGGTNQIIQYAKKYAIPSKIFRIIPNGVNTKNYINNLNKKKEYRSKYDIDQDCIVVLFIGRFEENKGAIEFAQAAKLIIDEYETEFEFLMVGSGKLENNIKSIVNGKKKIHVLGWQDPDVIHQIYIAADIFVLPSKFEGLPLTIIEAMNANLYIIYSNVGGVQDILAGYSKKTVLPTTSPKDIFKLLIDLYNNKSFINNDVKSISYAQNFDWNNIAKEISLIYRELL